MTSTSEGWNKTAAAGLGGAAARMELPAKPRRVVPTTPARTLQTARLHARCGEIILKSDVWHYDAYRCHIEYHCHYIFLFNCYCYCGIVVLWL